MITLVTYPPAFGEPSSSPFCVKSIYQLNLSGLPWQRQDDVDPRKWPGGKLPAIRVGDEVIGDSDNIQDHINAQGVDLDAGLGDADRAMSRALIRMVEEHLYFHIVLDRWENDENWPLIRDTYFVEIPALLRGVIAGSIRKRTLAGLKTNGLGRMSPQERLKRAERDLQAITRSLWNGPFLFGAEPTAADTSVGAMLGAIRATPVRTPFSRRVAEDAILSEYADRVADRLG